MILIIRKKSRQQRKDKLSNRQSPMKIFHCMATINVSWLEIPTTKIIKIKYMYKKTEGIGRLCKWASTFCCHQRKQELESKLHGTHLISSDITNQVKEKRWNRMLHTIQFQKPKKLNQIGSLLTPNIAFFWLWLFSLTSRFNVLFET